MKPSKHRKALNDIQLNKIRFVRVSSKAALARYSHLKNLELNRRYKLQNKQLIKPDERVAKGFDVKSLIHQKAFMVICL